MNKLILALCVLGTCDMAIAAPAASQPASQPEVYQKWPFDAKEAGRRQDETGKALGADKEMSLSLTDKVDMKFKLIPAGKFLMGSSPATIQMLEDLNKRVFHAEVSYLGEGPQHDVTITKPFYMGVYHVTRGQFAAFVADAKYKTGAESGYLDGPKGLSWQNPSFEQTDDHPVLCMTWNDAMAFCKWMSKKTGRAIGLPTEAQWEYAARAGVATVYPWGDKLEGGAGWLNAYDKTAEGKVGKAKPMISWSDGFVYTSPVGKFKPNQWGLYDVLGNASQWVVDWQDADYYKNSPKEDPPGPPGGTLRRGRGGCYTSQMPRLGGRAFYNPDKCLVTFGFRVICTDVVKK
jgi:formylglycine-generating enzyme